MTRRVLAAAVMVGTFGAGLSLGPAVDRLTRVSAQTGGGTTAATTFPNRRYNQGTETIGPVQIPVGAIQLTVRATRDSWPNIGSEVLQVMTQISFNGGNTWQDWGGFGARGGDLIGRDGSIAPESTMRIMLPDELNPQRQLRAVVTVNRALSTAITVQVD